jgi:hypothetical protein
VGRDWSGVVVDEDGVCCVFVGVFFTLRNTIMIMIMISTLTSTSTLIPSSVNMILLRDHAPSPSALGTTNGLAQLFMSLARAISPAFASSLFALSVDGHLLGGQLWVAAMVGVALVGIAATRRIAGTIGGGRRVVGRVGGAHDVAME